MVEALPQGRLIEGRSTITAGRHACVHYPWVYGTLWITVSYGQFGREPIRRAISKPNMLPDFDKPSLSILRVCQYLTKFNFFSFLFFFFPLG